MGHQRARIEISLDEEVEHPLLFVEGARVGPDEPPFLEEEGLEDGAEIPLLRMGEQDQCATASEVTGGRCDQLGSTDGVEGGVEAPAVAELGEGGAELSRRQSAIGSHAGCLSTPPGIRLGHHDGGVGEESAQQEDVQQTHRARAEDEAGERQALDGEPVETGSIDASQDTRGRLEENRSFGGELGRQAAGREFYRRGGDTDLWTEAPGVELVLAEQIAAGLGARPAEAAPTAGEMVRGGHPVADGEVARTLADREDLADHLVTEDGSGVTAAGDLVEIGAAQSAREQPDDELTGFGRRLGAFLEDDAWTGLRDDHLHRDRGG